MKKQIAILALVTFVACAFAQEDPQDLGQLAGGGTTGTTQSGSEAPLITGASTASSSASASVRIGDEDFDKPVGQPTYNKFYNDNRSTTYNKYVRAGGSTKTMPQQPINNITVNVPDTSNKGTSVKNPNMDGVAKFDPNKFPTGSGDLTVSLGADGSALMSRSSGSDFPWLPVLGVLTLVALVAMVVVGVGNRTGSGSNGGNHYHNYPPTPQTPQPQQAPAPQGGAAQPAPFVPQPQPGPNPPGGAPGTGGPRPEEPGWIGKAVIVMAHPTGNLPVEKPKRQDPPVVVNIYNNQPPQKEAQEKKPAANATEQKAKK